jgi:hypothetical protein
LKTGEAMLPKAGSPQRDGIATAVQFVGDLEIGGLIRGGQA